MGVSEKGGNSHSQVLRGGGADLVKRGERKLFLEEKGSGSKTSRVLSWEGKGVECEQDTFKTWRSDGKRNWEVMGKIIELGSEGKRLPRDKG